MGIELDHVFVFVSLDAAMPGGWIDARLAALGLEASYARRHAGQGTANVCYCFDNAYLELLFVVDEAELVRSDVARNGFVQRARWRETGASPFGIAVRGGPLPFATWPYRIDAFPPGLSVPVATASDDVRVPFVFGSPGSAPPDAWTNGLAGRRQTEGGFDRLSIEMIAGRDAKGLEAQMVRDGVAGRLEIGAAPSMTLLLEGGEVDAVRLQLPDFTMQSDR